jgi:hypothetical protein
MYHTYHKASNLTNVTSHCLQGVDKAREIWTPQRASFDIATADSHSLSPQAPVQHASSIETSPLVIFEHLSLVGQNVGVTLVDNGHGRAAVQFTASGAELDLYIIVRQLQLSRNPLVHRESGPFSEQRR